MAASADPPIEPSCADWRVGDAGWPRTLFHFVAGAVHGGGLVPAPYRYAWQLPAGVRARCAPSGTDVSLLWAATRLSKALAFGMRGRFRASCMNIAAVGIDAEFHACRADADLWRVGALGTLFALNGATFIDFPADSGFEHQAVSVHRIDGDDLQVLLRPRSVMDLMQAGLQLLTLRGSEAEMERLIDRLCACPDTAGRWDLLRRQLADGRLCWENARRLQRKDDALAAYLAG